MMGTGSAGVQGRGWVHDGYQCQQGVGRMGALPASFSLAILWVTQKDFDCADFAPKLYRIPNSIQRINSQTILNP